MRNRLAAGIMLTILVAVPIEGQVAGRSAIEQVLADFVTAFNAKDVATLASLYADDALLLPEGVPMVKGRAAIEPILRTMISSGGVLRFNPPSEIEVTGDRAVAAGTYTVSIPGSGGAAPQVIAAKYLTVFARVGTAWKIAYDMQNLDPAPN